MVDRIGGGFKEYAPAILRVGLAVIFIRWGAENLLRGGTSAGNLVMAGVELLGALFVLIGFLTRWAAAALMVLSIVVIVEGPGTRAFVREEHQLIFACLVMSFALFGLGGGKWSVDVSNKKKKEEG